MLLEHSLKHFNPKGLFITDCPSATACDGLTATDVMAALGMCESRAALGFSLFMARHRKDEAAQQKAVKLLTAEAVKLLPTSIRRAAGRRSAKAARILSQMAIECYCRTIDDPGMKCPQCKGRGEVAPIILAAGAGLVCDMELQGEETGQRSVPLKKTCPRCHGSGMKAFPSARAYRAVVALFPELPQRTWTENWKPFFDDLKAICHDEVVKADGVFKKATSFG